MKRLIASRALRHTLAWTAGSGLAWAALSRVDVDPLLHGIAVLAVGLGLIRLAGLTLFRGILPALGLQTPRIAEEVALLAAYVAWGIVRLRTAGMDVAQLVTTSAVITAVLAFAMQDTLGNVLAGLFLELDRSIMIGDWVRLDDLSGRVVEIRWRHTAIRTRNGELAIVPNSALMKARFLIVPQAAAAGEGRLRRWIWFDVDFDVPGGKVIAAARRALDGAEIPNVAREPAPDCVLMELALGQARYALRYWLLDPRHDDGTDSAVRMHLLASLERKGIAPSLPKQMTHEFRETEARDAARRAREADRRAAMLRGVELFAMLTEAERHELAQHLVPAPFAAGDVVTRQGMVAHWLYILAEGEVDIWLEGPKDNGGGRTRLATLRAGSVFGEMGMMTGEPRRATVTARSDVQCYRLDKEGFAGVLHARPEIADGLARVLAARNAQLEEASHQSPANAAPAHHAGLAERIRSFFGLETVMT